MPTDRDGAELDPFNLDLHRLDEEWVQHVRYHRSVAVKVPAARRRWEEAKRDKEVAEVDLKKVAAELELKIRRNPGKYGLEKVTDHAVEKVALLQPEYAQAQEEKFAVQDKIIKTKEELDTLEAVLESLEHQKKALENLVVLHGRDYFAAPRVRQDGYGRREDVLGQERREAIRAGRKADDGGGRAK